MKPLKFIIWSGRIQSFTPPAFAAFWLAVLLMLSDWTSQAAGTVSNCTESDLRAALSGGGTVNFACDGTITLANTIEVWVDTVLDGSGHQVTISGNNTVRVFYVGRFVNFSVVNLTIANGQSTDGAGVLNDAGTLIFTGTTFVSNIATNAAALGTHAASCGGAICDQGGSVTVSNCAFIGNRAFGSRSDSFYSSGFFGVAGGDGLGGAIYSVGQLNIESSTFDGNVAQGGVGGVGTGSESLSSPSYAGAGGSGSGGALWLLGTASVSASTFTRNVAVGGLGGIGGMGGFGMIGGGVGGSGGAGGSANGAALFNGWTLTMVNCTITSNTAAGAAGGGGGMGGFGIFGGSGGNGGAGGAGFGSICGTNGLTAVTNCTIALNASQGGVGGYGGMGGMGTPDGHNGGWGANGTGGIAAGGLRTFGAKLLNTLLAANLPTNCSGTITDLGHNLSSDGSCAFTGLGSMNNTNPNLGPLANNGGPTLTMALLPGSPAIDAGSATGAPATDQRGVTRPHGPGVDIGAFEYQYVPTFMDAKLQSATNVWLQMSGLLPSKLYTLQTSTNLTDWSDLTNLAAGQSGICEFVDCSLGKCASRFYRLRVSTQ